MNIQHSPPGVQYGTLSETNARQRVSQMWAAKWRSQSLARALRRSQTAPGSHVLYMAAVAAIKYNRILAEFYQRLRDAGKPASVALVAVMRKMLRVLNRLIADHNLSLAQ